MAGVAKTGDKSSNPNRKEIRRFDMREFLTSTGVARRIGEYRKSQQIYAQGDLATNVIYIQDGGVKLSVVSAEGKEAVVALLGQGDFLGEACLSGLPLRIEAAVAITATTVLIIDKHEMTRVLHKES